MTKNKKYLIWGALILVTFIAVISYANQIEVWLMSKFTDLIILAVVFLVGWLLGRFGRRSNRDNKQKNAKNITEAQK